MQGKAKYSKIVMVICFHNSTQILHLRPKKEEKVFTDILKFTIWKRLIEPGPESV